MSQNKVNMLFLPSIFGISHIAPLVNASRFFASHPNVQVTIIITQQYAQIFQPSIDHDREAGHDIGFHIVDIPFAEVGLPVDTNPEKILSSTSSNLHAIGKLFRAVGLLSSPVLNVVCDLRADCLVSDLLNPWAADVASKAHIPLITFTPASLFAVCVDDSLTRFKPHENVDSDCDSFVLPGLPDKIELTRSRLPDYCKDENVGKEFKSSVQRALDMSFCMLVNSFDELELKYAEYCKNVIGIKCCLVGPLQSRSDTKSDNKDDKNNGDDEILEWLNDRAEKSVLYVSFGSYAPICKDQFHEIAHGLEGSGRFFIWVARANLSGEQGEQGWFPEGFEERVKKSNQGLVVKTWAPQEVILGHPSVGAFMTHCGWNSCLETLAHGVPVITWPLRVEQFNHERLMVDVLRVGFGVGNDEWTSQHGQLKVTVTRDKVEAAVRRIMDNDAEEVMAMRKQAQHFVEKSKAAVREGGSSYGHVYALVEELKARRKESFPIV